MDTGEYRLAPLSAMRNALIAIRTGERRRLGSGYPDEVQPLAREIDSLLDARDAQLEKARARAADLAHGLKTPLQVLSGEAERLKTRGAVDIAGDIESITEDMQRHIERHLTRTRLRLQARTYRPIFATSPSASPGWSSGRRQERGSPGRTQCRPI